MAVGGLLAYAVEERARLHRATASVGATPFSANGIVGVVATTGLGVSGLAGLLLGVARGVRSDA